MKNKEVLNKFLQGNYPVWGYSPKGITDPSLSIALSRLNGVGLVDLEGLSKSQSKDIIIRCFSELDKSNLWGVRVSSKEQLIWLEEFDFLPIIIIAFETDEDLISTFTTDCDLLVAEVNYF